MPSTCHRPCAALRPARLRGLRWPLAALLWLGAIAALAPPARADRVTTAEQIHIGVQDQAIPFSYRIGEGYAGYTVEICQRVLAALEAARGKPYANAPATRWVSVTPQTRLMQLLAGDIDLECSSTSITRPRAQLGLAFSLPTFVSDIGVLMRSADGSVPASADQWLAQLHDGHATVVTTEGSTSVQHLAWLNGRSRGTPLQVVYGRDHDHSLQLLIDGAAKAFVMDRALLTARLASDARLRQAGLVLASWSPLPTEIGTETYAIVMRDADDDLRRIVQQTLCGLARSAGGGPSALQQLYQRWFEQPIPQPGGGGNLPALALPMHGELARRLAAPPATDCPG